MASKVSASKSKKKGAMQRKVKVKVPRFTTEELNEDIDIFLTTYNPYMSENCVEFDRKSGTYKPVLDYRKPVLVLKFEGIMMKRKPQGEEILFETGEKQEQEKKMTNKFNFRQAATQTLHRHTSERGNQIESSLFPVFKFKGTASKSEIFAAYEYHEKNKKERSQYYWIPKALKNVRKYVGRKPTPLQDSNRKFLRLCERMIDQNLSESNLDYSYYDNPNDEFSPNFGSLLPLWRFRCSLTKELPVTDIVWSAHFSDLFAVSYRSLKDNADPEDDLGMLREGGILCVYSLKGPRYPEKIVESSTAVCCLSFHPEFSHLLATGCEGGILNVYDLRKELNDPAGSNKMTEKMLHHDTVNKLRWFPDVLPQKFCTISTDGNVLSWQFLLNDLSLFDDVTSLKVKELPGELLLNDIKSGSESSEELTQELGTRMAGTSLSLNHHLSDFFLVGTKAGSIYKCSFDGKNQLDTFHEHKMSVFRVQWNPYHPGVFLSCSADMTVRIWDDTMRESIFEFFFQSDVKDACWAPYSSTLFGVISGNATIYVFDLAVDKKEAIGIYTVYTAKEGIDLTTVCFHPTKPVLMVGDERGYVISFKLSPNLRSSLKARETMQEAKFIEAEISKMEKLLAPAKGKIKRN